MSDRAEKRTVFSPVKLEVQRRSGHFDVIQMPDTLPNIIGQIPLEHLDWVVDPQGCKLIPNPEHKHGELADEFLTMRVSSQRLPMASAPWRSSRASQNRSKKNARSDRVATCMTTMCDCKA